MSMWREAVMVCCVLVLGGCATITRGTKEVLVVESEPVGAQVRTSTGLTGTTPATFKVKRRGGFVVDITKEGYEPVSVQVSSHISAAGGAGMAGNVILGGIIGAAVDAGTGAMHTLKPNPIQVKLNPIQSAIMQDGGSASDPLSPPASDSTPPPIEAVAAPGPPEVVPPEE